MTRRPILIVLTLLGCVLQTTMAAAYKPGVDGPWSRREYDQLLSKGVPAVRAARREALRRVEASATVPDKGVFGADWEQWARRQRERQSQYRTPTINRGQPELRTPTRPAVTRQSKAHEESTLADALTRLAGGTGTPGDRELLNRQRNERQAGSANPAVAATPSIPPNGIAALLEGLQSQEALTRHGAAYRLRFAGAAAQAAIPALLKALQDTDSDVRWVAAGTLGALASGAPEAAQALAQSLRDPVPQVRRAATDALLALLP